MSRSLGVLSATYVQRRARLADGIALTGRGKRAAFALYFGPLHYLLVRGIVERLPHAAASRRPILDLGCGTGAAGVAWADLGNHRRDVTGVDVSAWALGEAASAYRCFGLRGRTVRGSVAGLTWPRGPLAIVAAFALNELTEPDRAAALRIVLDRVALGDQVLIIEPLAKGVAPWWSVWRREFEAAGGRADEWRFPADLPPLAARLGHAARLHHRDVTGRSLWHGGRSALTD